MLSIVIPVYRNARSALDLVADLARQRLPTGLTLEIIMVDDGSGDDTHDVLASAESSLVRVVALPENTGRATACNTGATQANGRYIVFIDCDCRPVGDSFLASHVEVLDNGCIAACGPLAGSGSGFWKKYQDDASLVRARRHAAGVAYAGTTANCSVNADAFRKVGGFDVRYRTYGFEDRDLLIRLSTVGAIGWCDTAIMQHCDRLTLSGLVAKMREAAGQSAVVFSGDHPDAYRQLGYAALDSRLRPWLKPAGTLSRWLVDSSGRVEPWLDSRWMPYPFARIAVKLLSGLAYLQGSMRKGTRSSNRET